MTKSNPAPQHRAATSSFEPADHLPHGDVRAQAEDERQDNAASDNDNGGGASGNQGNGSGG